MRILFTVLALVAVGLTGCFEESAPSGTTSTSTTTSASQTTTSSTTTPTNTTTSTGPQPTCFVWIRDITSGRTTWGTPTGAQWRVFVDVDPAASSKGGIAITVKIEQLGEDGEPTRTADTQTQETESSGARTFIYRPFSGSGHYRLTVTDIEYSRGGDDCAYDEDRNEVPDFKDQHVF